MVHQETIESGGQVFVVDVHEDESTINRAEGGWYRTEDGRLAYRMPVFQRPSGWPQIGVGPKYPKPKG